MNEILADRQLRDLIERCERVLHALDATFEPTPEEFCDLARTPWARLVKRPSISPTCARRAMSPDDFTRWLAARDRLADLRTQLESRDEP